MSSSGPQWHDWINFLVRWLEDVVSWNEKLTHCSKVSRQLGCTVYHFGSWKASPFEDQNQAKSSHYIIIVERKQKPEVGCFHILHKHFSVILHWMTFCLYIMDLCMDKRLRINECIDPQWLESLGLVQVTNAGVTVKKVHFFVWFQQTKPSQFLFL